MKKVVYECGEGEYRSECEINYIGNMLIIEPSRSAMSVDSLGYEGLLGIDLVSMMELTGDMAEQFIKKGGARPDTVEVLEGVVITTREYLNVMMKGKVIA